MSVAPVSVVEDLPEEEVVSLRQLVREQLELSEEPDPHRAINGMVQHLPHDVLVRAAQFGLVEVAKYLVRQERRPRYVPEGSAKWAAVAEVVAYRRDVFALRVWTGTVWKFMADCTKHDLKSAAAVKRTQADGLTADADRFDKLARLVKPDATVVDVPRAKVEGIFNA